MSNNHLSYLRNVKTVPSPSGWTPETKYIDKLFWSPNVPAELRDLYQPANPKVQDPRRTINFMNEHVNLIGTFPGTKEQKRNVKIKKITDKEHPCCGAYGLVAAQTLQPKQLIIDYLGVVEYQDGYEATSDYVLRYGTDLSIDAGRCGNEARFCNDFRGCGPEPNVCFMNYMDEKTKHIKVGIFVNGNRKIRKGDELLVTYGKSFWAKRGIDMSGQQHKK
ncbi:Protein kinase domain-containing protein [Mucor velutinosus]|uniref:Protein kinase domain-containing protein n=1 Tax=Mucor velutinosus TaxID=708070 RepID=A0AAN7DGK8_9FUNG|nr:Protein kinase domain-containing protein [Mucor velutinosus]